MSGHYQPDPRWADHVRRLVDEAPPISPAMADRLAILLQLAPPPSDEQRTTSPAA